jgi:hypothetical protein
VRQGDTEVDLEPEMHEAIRYHDLIELTGWSFEYIDSAPAVRLDQLLMVRAADILAQKKASED